MIDWDRIDELRGEIGADDFAEVAEIFLDELQEVIERLVTGPSATSLEEPLHFIKGCALNVGFAQLAAIASDGERLAASGSSDAVDLAEPNTCFTASQREFLERFGDAQAA